ncbi:hypothetical protein RhiLY_08696 [Ceratobasidium sp. AG-Ba]|nr:hypothetical protein RhiLY_08696 [Ceratobasidium sp. AG-Ba]
MVYDDHHTKQKTVHTIKTEQSLYKKCLLAVLDPGLALTGSQNSHPVNAGHRTRRGQDFVLAGRVLQSWASGNEDQSTLGMHERSEMSGPLEKSRNAGRSGASWTSGTNRQPTGISQHTPVTLGVKHWYYSKANIFPHRHYRIVLEEIGTPVRHLRNYKDMITAIKGGSEGTHAIHLAQRVHRDISSENILLVKEVKDEADLGIIIDLEHIKDLEQESNPHDVNKGMYQLMATEVAYTTYMHAPPRGKILDSPSEPRTVPPFRQNQLHDVESIWWVFMWMVLRIVGPFDIPNKEFLVNYSSIFDKGRNIFFANEPIFEKYTAHSAKRDIPDAMQI